MFTTNSVATGYVRLALREAGSYQQHHQGLVVETDNEEHTVRLVLTTRRHSRHVLHTGRGDFVAAAAQRPADFARWLQAAERQLPLARDDIDRGDNGYSHAAIKAYFGRYLEWA